MNSQLSLLQIIREQKKKNNKPLKVICDWDECIMPVRPWAAYLFTNKQVPFKGEFFEDFWENTFVEGGSTGGNKSIKYKGKDEEIRKGVENFRL